MPPARVICSPGDTGLAAVDALLDVRSPGEFALDHAPGAINPPVLSDAERECVGAIYVQRSRFEANRIGAAYVARNIARRWAEMVAPGGVVLFTIRPGSYLHETGGEIDRL